MSNKRCIVGVDNGVTGNISMLYGREALLFRTPVFKQLNYTKTKQFLNRVNGKELRKIFERIPVEKQNTIIGLERPLVNPGRFKATISAIRCLEATLIVIEMMGLPYCYVDSIEWKKQMLPNCDKLNQDDCSLKKASKLFPHIDLDGFSNANSLLIAKWMYLNGK